MESKLKAQLCDIIKLFFTDDKNGTKTRGKNVTTPQKTNQVYYGTVTHVNGDGTYKVKIADNEDVECKKMVGAKEGDTVMLMVKSAGMPVAIATVGGDTDAADAQETADDALLLAQGAKTEADNTASHFWSEDGTGTEAGAHITEVPQDEWKDSSSPNYHSGANLLLLSSVIKLRNALDTLAELAGVGLKIFEPGDSTNPVAQFLSSGIKIGKPTDVHWVFKSDGLFLYEPNEDEPCAAITTVQGSYSYGINIKGSQKDIFDLFTRWYSIVGHVGSNGGHINLGTQWSSDTEPQQWGDTEIEMQHSQINLRTSLHNVPSSTGYKDHIDFYTSQLTVKDYKIFDTYTATGSTGSVASGSYAALTLTGTVPSGYKPIAISNISSDHNAIGAITRWALNTDGTINATIRNFGSGANTFNVTATVLCVREEAM